MKINMATDEYFNIGMIVSCETCHGRKLQGEVMAFDYTSKMLVLKSPGSKPGTHDVQLVNLSFVSDMKVLHESEEAPSTLRGLNLSKVHTRVRQSIEEKLRQVNYIGVGVSPLAQKLFFTITKTISDVKWEGQNIVVMNETYVYPPYGIDNCKGKQPALNHVKKVVEKYYKDQQREPSPASSSSSS